MPRRVADLPRSTPLSDRVEAITESLAREAHTYRWVEDDDAAPVSVEARCGGMPYREPGESWPICPQCKRPAPFLVQLPLSSGALACIYGCADRDGCDGRSGQGFEDVNSTPGGWSPYVVRVHLSPELARAWVDSSSMGEVASPKVGRLAFETALRRAPPELNDAAKLEPNLTHLLLRLDTCAVGEPRGPRTAREVLAIWEELAPSIEALQGAGSLPSSGIGVISGGYPDWLRGSVWPECELCGVRMHFEHQLVTDDVFRLFWHGDGRMYMFACREHPDQVVARGDAW